MCRTFRRPGLFLWKEGSLLGLVCLSGPHRGRQVSGPLQCPAAACPAHYRWRARMPGYLYLAAQSPQWKSLLEKRKLQSWRNNKVNCKCSNMNHFQWEIKMTYKIWFLSSVVSCLLLDAFYLGLAHLFLIISWWCKPLYFCFISVLLHIIVLLVPKCCWIWLVRKD